MKQTGLIINKNNLAGYKNGQLVSAKYVRTYNNQEWINVKRILANQNLKTVWEVNEYLLEANDSFTMPPQGGDVESNLSILSRLNRPDGSYDWVEYTVDPSSISPNTGTTTKEYVITITQNTSNLQITSKCVQEGDTYYGIVYEVPEVTSVTAATAEAVGEDVMLTVRYTQKVIYQYASGNKTETVSGTINPTIDSGTAKINNVTKDGKYIKVPNAGTTTYSSDRIVYVVNGYSFTVNGKAKTVTGVSIDVKQEANIIEYTTATDGFLDISANPTTVAAANHSSTISVNCYKNVRDVYTSGALGDPVRENAEATLTSSTGTFYPRSPIMGGSTTVFSPLENSTDKAVTHTINATFKVGSNTYTDSCTINQDKVNYEFEVKPLSINVPYTGQNNYKVIITSSKNGHMWDINNSNIEVSGPSGLTYHVELDDINLEDNRYNLFINVSSNNTNVTRTFYVTITQPDSGNTETVTVYQAAKPSSGGELTANIDATYSSDTQIDVDIDFSGTSDMIRVYVQIEDVDGTVISERKNYDITVGVDRITDNFTVSEYTEPCYVVVYKSDNNAKIGRKIVK